MTQKQSKQKQISHPTLVYLCSKKDSKIKTTIQEDLCKSYFVRTNSNADDFVECCYAITSSSVFIFILDDSSVHDIHCLSLLSTAIAFDIPVVGVREAGYALPYEFPKIYSSTEIVDRSKSFEYKVKSKNLPSVTTLASALKVLFMQCVIYHERIRTKCNKEIKEMLNGVQIKRVIVKKFEKNDDNNSLNDDTLSQGSDIQEWPQLNNTDDFYNINRHKKSIKAPEPRKPLGPSSHEQSLASSRTNGGMVISKCKIRVHSPGDSSAKRQQETEGTRKERSRTTMEKHPRNTLRRMSSLPCIKTNYMVTNCDEKNTEPKIYRFPLSPNMLSAANKNDNDVYSNNLDDEFERLQLSRSCSPVDYRSDEESLLDINVK